MRKALLIVDVQNDFCTGGALAVPNGDQVIPPLNKLIHSFSPFPGSRGWLIAASRDWHPAYHCSFKEQGGTWPPHCIQNTNGACLHRDLNIHPLNSVVFDKGFKHDKDSYSAFGGSIVLSYMGTFGLSFSLEEILRKLNTGKLYVGGLATDYCIKATAFDAVRKSFKTYLLLDACRAVNIKPGDGDKAVEEMRNVGVIITTTDEVLKETHA